MKILLYSGKSWVSRLIRLQTRSRYSHAAVQLPSGTVVEAWRRGVHMILGPFAHHSVGTVIEVYSVEGDYNLMQVKEFLTAQLGKKYDFRAIFRFLSRRPMPADDRWFCSELVISAFAAGGLDLLNGPASELSPRDLSLSTCLVFEGVLKDPRPQGEGLPPPGWFTLLGDRSAPFLLPCEYSMLRRSLHRFQGICESLGTGYKPPTSTASCPYTPLIGRFCCWPESSYCGPAVP